MVVQDMLESEGVGEGVGVDGVIVMVIGNWGGARRSRCSERTALVRIC